GGLLPSAQGHKVTMTGSKVTVTDGPFAETKEVIGGFAILNYDSHEAAIEGAKRVMKIHADTGVTDLEIEIRPMFDPQCTQWGPSWRSASPIWPRRGSRCLLSLSVFIDVSGTQFAERLGSHRREVISGLRRGPQLL